MSNKDNLNSRQMMYSALEGKKLLNFPVAAPYMELSNSDHWVEVTDLPPWEYYKWLISEPDRYVEKYIFFNEKMPFDILPPPHSFSREYRENTEVLCKDNVYYYHNKKDDAYRKLELNIHHSYDARHIENRIVFDKADVREKVKVIQAENLIAKGYNDNLEKIVKDFSGMKFIFNGYVSNVFFDCSLYVGLSNLLSLLYDEPDLIDYLSGRLQERNIELVRQLAAAGGDAIFVQDIMSTNDMISVKFYEKLSLPYLTQTVKEIHRNNKKAVLIYSGGIADRVEQIISTGADGLMMETSMKGYVNDFDAIAEQVNGRMCLFGNIDPIGMVQEGSDDELYEAIARQVETGKKYGKYVTGTGGPVTPKTPVSRIRRFIDIAHEL